MLLDCSNTKFVSIETSSMFQRYSSAEQRPIVSDPCQGSSCKENDLQIQLFFWEAAPLRRQVSYVFAPAMERDFILRDATEPWKAEDATCTVVGTDFISEVGGLKFSCAEFNP